MTTSIIFMGTPDFSVLPLQALYDRGFHISLVISQPDRPKGRGQKMIATPVKKKALDLGLNVIQPMSVNQPDVIAQVESLKPDFFVVVAFGQFIGEKLLSLPCYAPINIHGSLLPAYRGAAPIQRAIINGETTTGITTMLMDKGMDSGDMLLKEELMILPSDTTATLHDRLSLVGARLIVETIEAFMENRITPQPQDPEKATVAPMLKKAEGLTNWTRTARELDCFIRGMNPWPGAYTFLSDKRFKLFKAEYMDLDHDQAPGTILECDSDRLIVQAGQKAISILEIQGESGKRLPIADFLRGVTFKKGDIFR